MYNGGPRDYGSLSARRAWIEIMNGSASVSPPASLSARRAWIEIGLYGSTHGQ